MQDVNKNSERECIKIVIYNTKKGEYTITIQSYEQRDGLIVIQSLML